MKQTKPTNWSAFLLFIAILFGGLMRFMPAAVTRFPINDGGMFYDMTRDLQVNHYLLPSTTSYNGLDLPYAYPPLGFYVASLLADLGRIPLLALFLWLPALFATLSIPAFYLLALTLLSDDLRAALAAVFFALTPGAYDWHIMGGGVTRSIGLIFLLLAVRQVYLLFRSDTTSTAGNILLSIFFCSLAVLSHPEIALQTVGLCAILWLFFGRIWRGVLHATLVSLGVAALTAPWWGTVLAQHGLAPFLSASQTGLHGSNSWLKFFSESYTLIGIFPFLLLLRVIGTVYAFMKRKWLLLVMLVFPYIVDPRSAPAITFLVFNLLCALALLDGVPALITWVRKSAVPSKPLLETRAGVIMLLTLVILQFVDCGLNNFRLINTTLTSADQAAFAWIKNNLPAGKDFFIITTKPYSMSDPVQEWFPTLTGLQSQTTLQGMEWNLCGDFLTRLNDLADLQECIDVVCVDDWSAYTGLTYDYIWVTVLSVQVDPKQNAQTAGLVESLQDSGRFVSVYDETSFSSERIVIFEQVEK